MYSNRQKMMQDSEQGSSPFRPTNVAFARADARPYNESLSNCVRSD